MNLFRGLSRALVQLSHFPLPWIGSFVLDEKGYLRLKNRPLSLQIHQPENEGIPVDMPRHTRYESTFSYLHDVFALYASRLRHQPNAVAHLEDGALSFFCSSLCFPASFPFPSSCSALNFCMAFPRFLITLLPHSAWAAFPEDVSWLRRRNPSGIANGQH